MTPAPFRQRPQRRGAGPQRLRLAALAVAVLLAVEPAAGGDCDGGNALKQGVDIDAVSAAVAHCSQQGNVVRLEDVLCVNGMIGAETARLFIEQFEGVKLVVVNSGGGESHASIQMAEAIWRANLDVAFHRICYSACANYLFLAARTKILVDDVVMAWHGSPALFPVSRVTDLGEAARVSVLRQIREHQAFLAGFGEERRIAFSRLMDEPPPRVRATRGPLAVTYNRYWWYPDEDLCSRFKVEGIVRVRSDSRGG